MTLQANHDSLVWSLPPNGAPSLDYSKGVFQLSPQGFTALGPTVTPPALSKFLSAMTGKQFQNPPGEMLASRGLGIYDLLELFTGKAMPGRVGFPHLHTPCLPSLALVHLTPASASAGSSGPCRL